MLKSMAHSAIGVTDLKTGDYAGAETELKAAADLSKARPDPYVWYQLALAQDHQKKYAEALASVIEGLRYTDSAPDLAQTLAGGAGQTDETGRSESAREVDRRRLGDPPASPMGLLNCRGRELQFP